MMRTILFLHFHPASGRLNELVKRIPYAPEDSELYFIDISRAEKETLGMETLKYLNNHYEDDVPYVWNGQPAHIASVEQSLPHMRLHLLKAMRQFCRDRLARNRILADENELSGRMQLFQPAFEPKIVSRRGDTYAVSRDLSGVTHWFGLRTSHSAPELLRQMIREVWLERKSNFQNEIRLDTSLLDLLNVAIRDAEGKTSFD